VGPKMTSNLGLSFITEFLDMRTSMN